MRPIDSFLVKLDGVKRIGDGRWKSKCPAHADRSPSLSLKELANGDVLFHCFAGCQFGDVIAALEMRASECFAESKMSTPQYRKLHKLHEAEAEYSVLQSRYGFSSETAKALVRVGVQRHAGGLA